MKKLFQITIILAIISYMIFACKKPIDYEGIMTEQKTALNNFLLNEDDHYDIDTNDKINGIYLKVVEEIIEEEVPEGDGEETTDNTTTVVEAPGPTIGNNIEIQYIGRVINGNDNPIFEEAEIVYKHGTGYVIKGLYIAISNMAEGDSAIVVVPTDLGYGSAKQGKVPVYSNLLYELKLLNVQ